MDEQMNSTQPGQGSGVGQVDTKQQVMGFVAKVEAWLHEYMVTKAPFQIPMEGKEILAKIAPYLIIVFSLLAVPAVLALVGISTVVAPVAMMAGVTGWGFFGLISLATTVITLVLNVMAISGLFKRTNSSWRLLFYSSLVSFVGGVLSMNPIGAVIGGVIGWYILFQVKELYKN